MGSERGHFCGRAGRDLLLARTSAAVAAILCFLVGVGMFPNLPMSQSGWSLKPRRESAKRDHSETQQ